MKRIFALLLIAGAAHAQVTTLTYQGGTLSGNYVGFREGPACLLNSCVTGTITLPAPLAANLPALEISGGSPSVAMSFQIYALGGGGPPYFSLGSASFSTDARGKITGWLIVATSDDGTSFLMSSTITDIVTNGPDWGGPYPIYSTAGPGTWTQSALVAPPVVAPPPPVTVKVLDCSNYKVVAPSNALILNVSPNASGSPSECKEPSTVPSSWYIKTTADGGHSWQWVSTLNSLGLGE